MAAYEMMSWVAGQTCLPVLVTVKPKHMGKLCLPMAPNISFSITR